jgi:hypothetical protein
MYSISTLQNSPQCTQDLSGREAETSHYGSSSLTAATSQSRRPSTSETPITSSSDISTQALEPSGRSSAQDEAMKSRGRWQTRPWSPRVHGWT